MKKVFSIIIILIIFSCIVSCKNKSIEQKIFEEFINSEHLYFTMDFTKHKVPSTKTET